MAPSFSFVSLATYALISPCWFKSVKVLLSPPSNANGSNNGETLSRPTRFQLESNTTLDKDINVDLNKSEDNVPYSFKNKMGSMYSATM